MWATSSNYRLVSESMTHVERDLLVWFAACLLPCWLAADRARSKLGLCSLHAAVKCWDYCEDGDTLLAAGGAHLSPARGSPADWAGRCQDPQTSGQSLCPSNGLHGKATRYLAAVVLSLVSNLGQPLLGKHLQSSHSTGGVRQPSLGRRLQ